MAATIEWNIPFSLTTRYGTIPFNAASGDRYLLLPDKCQMGVSAIRTTTDDVPQGDGGILHRVFKSFYTATLAFELWKDGDPACGADAVSMWDAMMKHVSEIVEPLDLTTPAISERNPISYLRWTPTGKADRTLDRIKLLQWPSPTISPPFVEAAFTVHSQYPFARDFTLTTTSLGSAVVNNTGTAEAYPVFRVYGPTAGFTLTNHVYDVVGGNQIVYDGTRAGAGGGPGPGEYVEIDTFRQTVTLDGHPITTSSALAGIDIVNSNFWTLQPGSNSVSCVGATADMIWAPSWA